MTTLQTFRATFRLSSPAKPSDNPQDPHAAAQSERNQTFRKTFRTFRPGDLQAGGGYLIPPGRVPPQSRVFETKDHLFLSVVRRLAQSNRVPLRDARGWFSPGRGEGLCLRS